MMTRTKITLVAALLATTSSVALAQEFDPNLANRYPAYADPIGAHNTLRSAPVALQRGHAPNVLVKVPDPASSPLTAGGM